MYSQLAWLFELIKDADGAPTQGIVALQREHAATLAKELARWRALAKEVATLNAEAKKLDVPGVLLPTVKTE